MDHPKFRKDEKGNLLLNFGSYGMEVEVAAISGDGGRVLTVCEVGVAQVREVSGGTLVGELRPTSPLAGVRGASPVAEPFHVFIESAALNPDGSLALLGLNDGTAVVYGVDQATLLAVLWRPGTEPGATWGVIRAVRYSPDGHLALVGFPNRSVGLWSADGLDLVAFLEPPSGGRRVGRPFVRETLVTSVALSNDGRCVFAGASDMTAAIFDRESGSAVMEATDYAESMLAVFDDGARVGWATTGGTVWIARVTVGPQAAPHGTAPTEPRGSEGVEKCLDTGEHWAEVAFHAERALVRAIDGSIVLWSFDGDRTVLSHPDEAIRGFWANNASTVGLDGTRMHFPQGGKQIVLRDARNGIVITRDAQLVRAGLSPQGDVIATDGWKDEIELWDTATGELRHALPCPGGSGCFAFSPNGEWIATGEIGHGGGLYDRFVYLYDVVSGKRLFTLAGPTWQVRQVAFSPDGRYLACVADDLLVWDLQDPEWFRKKPHLCLPLDRTAGAVGFAGSRLLALEQGRVRVFEALAERLSFEAPIGYETPWTVSADGRYLSIGGKQTVSRFDLTTGDLERTIAANIPRPERLPPWPMADEHRIRGGAMLWRTEQGTFLHQSDGPRGWTEPLVLSPEGFVAVPCEKGAAILQVGPSLTSLKGFMPFQGKLRAGRVIRGEVLLVNEVGHLFRTALSEVSPTI